MLYEKNGDRPMGVASTTKMLTAALAVIEHGGLHWTVTVEPEQMMEGSSMYLRPGEEISVEALLYGLLLCSGNDAAAVLVDCCGGQETMVERMNAMACRIGMADSSFANPSVSTRKTTLHRPGYGASGGPGSQEPHVHAHLLQRPRGGGGAQHDKSQLIADAPAGLRRHEDGVYPGPPGVPLSAARGVMGVRWWW